MDLIQHTTNWVKGEVFQGKIMLGIGIVFLIAFLMIIKNQHELLQGMLIPLALMLLIFFSYGGYQILVRPTHIDKVRKIHQENPQKAQKKEYDKAMKDHQIYSVLKKVWAVLIMLLVIAFFFVSSNYLKGLSIGFIGLFLTTLILDSILHYRLLNYLQFLKG